MKKLYLFITILILFFQVKNSFAQIINIPDPNFKNYLLNNAAINTNGDNNISFLEAASFSGIIYINNLSISDVTGIETFQNLNTLVCENNQISSIDLSQNVHLTELWCKNNQLTNLILPPNGVLEKIDCRDNQLANLTLVPSLKEIHSARNQLTALDITVAPNLEKVWCYDNQIAIVDPTQCSQLHTINFRSNPVTTIDLTQNPLLEFINCRSTLIHTLDLSSNPLLRKVYSYDQVNLTAINIANGNNNNITNFKTTASPNLTCIQVDNVNYSTTNWVDIDPTTSFSTGCYPMSVDCPVPVHPFNIMVYPNPVSNQLTVHSSTPIITITILSIDGQKLKSANDNFISVAELPQGTYLIEVKTKEKLTYQQFLKN